METMMKSLMIGLGDHEYRGLKFRRCYDEYPYKNKKECNEFIDNLIKKKDDQSRQIWKNLAKKNYKDMIHISLSYSAVMFVSSFLLLFIGIIFSIINAEFFIKVGFGGFSLVLMLLNFYFTKRAKDLDKSIEANELWIDVIFEMN
jgi:hypothetical protein